MTFGVEKVARSENEDFFEIRSIENVNMIPKLISQPSMVVPDTATYVECLNLSKLVDFLKFS